MEETAEALIVGAGPAGLMAADVLSAAGRQVVIAEAMPSPGRKFLMAGKSGLNLTKDEPLTRFLPTFAEAQGPMATMLRTFGPEAVADWARSLGQPVFTGSTGRVFPVAMKASPLLRAWLTRLEAQGVTLRRRWRLIGIAPGRALFDTPEGERQVQAAVIVLALGGASWRRLGSDGAWTGLLEPHGIGLSPFAPANMGFRVDWSAHMAPHFGQPLKPLGLIAGRCRVEGEAVLSAKGLEGSGIYALYRPLRDGVPLALDLLPGLAPGDVARRLARPRGKATRAAHLRKTLGLDGVKRALVMEIARPLPDAPEDLARLLKALPIPLAGPRPMDEAISTAGGLRWDALDDRLMIRALPGVFAAGEMLDWEAPTGGYLITGCLATGLAAGEGAQTWLTHRAATG
ncbi:MAG: TIGR03862 family flavoprotein [Pseudomonadota bacterium]